jgi:ATP synthase protein I
MITMSVKENQNKKKQKLNQLNTYVKYSGLGFQMIGVIGLFTFIGFKIDESLESKTPIITALLSLVGVIISLYIVFKSLNKK